MRTFAVLLLVGMATAGPAEAFSDVEMVPAYVGECPMLVLNTKRYEEVLTATLALSSNGVKGSGETKSRMLPGVYVEPSQRGAFCRDVLADYGPQGRKLKGLVRKK
jgi:hypothetical protein